MTDGIDVGGFREWFPLELEMSDEDYIDFTVDHFADTSTSPETTRAVAVGLTGLIEQLKALDDDQTLLLAAWVLLPPGGTELEILTAARLQAVRIREGTTPAELVEDLISGADLHQPIHLEDLATASGPAQLVRARTYSTSDHGIDLQEVVCVIWLPEGQNYGIVLATLPMDDLVLASDAAGALAGLAATVTGA